MIQKCLTTSRMISCLASSSVWTALFSLLRTKRRSCSFSSRRRTFFMLSQPTPCPSRTLCTTSFRNCWFSLKPTVSVFSLNYWTLQTHINMSPWYLVLLTLPWGDGDSLFTVGLCLITEDFWSTSARGARAPVRGNLLMTFLNTTQDYKNNLLGSEEHSMVINCTHSSTFSPGSLNLICNFQTIFKK